MAFNRTACVGLSTMRATANELISWPWLDRSGAFVVLERKVSKGYDSVAGQLLRYVNWIKQNLAEPGQKSQGHDRLSDDDRRLAACLRRDPGS